METLDQKPLTVETGEVLPQVDCCLRLACRGRQSNNTGTPESEGFRGFGVVERKRSTQNGPAGTLRSVPHPIVMSATSASRARVRPEDRADAAHFSGTAVLDGVA